MYATVHKTAAYISPQTSDCFKGAFARREDQPNPCGLNAACNSGYRGDADASAATHPTPAPSAPQPMTDKSAPSPHSEPALSVNGKTEHGDTVHLEGRFGPILSPNETDIAQETLAGCPESDGRNLVRRLDLTIAITSSLSGHVQVVAPTVALNYEEGAEEIRKLDFIMSGPEGTVCSKGLGEREGYVVDLGTLQPHERRTLSIWVVLLDAITPADPHPSLKYLQKQEWLMSEPMIRVDGLSAISGGTIDATE